MQQESIKTYIVKEVAITMNQIIQYQHQIEDIMEMQYGKHRAELEVTGTTRGTQITLTFLALAVRSFVVVAVAAIRPVPACSVSTTWKYISKCSRKV